MELTARCYFVRVHMLLESVNGSFLLLTRADSWMKAAATVGCR